jgi:hypothetical protein
MMAEDPPDPPSRVEPSHLRNRDIGQPGGDCGEFGSILGRQLEPDTGHGPVLGAEFVGIAAARELPQPVVTLSVRGLDL